MILFCVLLNVFFSYFLTLISCLFEILCFLSKISFLKDSLSDLLFTMSLTIFFCSIQKYQIICIRNIFFSMKCTYNYSLLSNLTRSVVDIVYKALDLFVDQFSIFNQNVFQRKKNLFQNFFKIMLKTTAFLATSFRSINIVY